MASISWPKCGACRGVPAVCIGSESKAGCLPAACLHAQWIARGAATLQDTPVAVYAGYSIAASQVQQGRKVDLTVLLGSPALLLHRVLPRSCTYRTTAAAVSYTCCRVIHAGLSPTVLQQHMLLPWAAAAQTCTPMSLLFAREVARTLLRRVLVLESSSVTDVMVDHVPAQCSSWMK
jgi:hypothetical protein